MKMDNEDEQIEIFAIQLKNLVNNHQSLLPIYKTALVLALGTHMTLEMAPSRDEALSFINHSINKAIAAFEEVEQEFEVEE